MPAPHDQATIDLFAPLPVVKAPPAAKTQARRKDPATSRDAAVRAQGGMSTGRQAVLDAAKAAGTNGITVHDVGKHWRRMSDLKAMNWLAPAGIVREGCEVFVHRDFKPHHPPVLAKPPHPASRDLSDLVMELQSQNAGLELALQNAINVAAEARAEWDEAPSGMKAGKLLIALSGHLPGYRKDIDAIHAALKGE